MDWNKAFALASRYFDWEPHTDGQRDWIMDDSRNKVAACGRRWGKSESTAISMVLGALAQPGSIQFVIAPSDDQTKTIMRQCAVFFKRLPGSDKFVEERLSPYHQLKLRPATGCATGSVIQGRTAGPTGKGLRSNKAHRIVVDEAAYIPESIIYEAVRPMLADYDGQFVAISTPKGRNWFYRMWHEGISGTNPRYRAFRFPSSANPHLSREWLDDELARQSERVRMQEYYAEFLENEGQVFRGVTEAIANKPCDPAEPYIIGIDLAKTQDWTVLVVMDALGRMVDIQRWQRLSWPAQIERIKQFVLTYPHASVRIDATGVGDPIYDELRRLLPERRIMGITLNSTNKEQLIENLAMCLETKRITILNDGQLVHELMCYEYEQTAGLHMRYNAPDGEHDDCVIALALAAHEFRPNGSAKPLLVTASSVYYNDELD